MLYNVSKETAEHFRNLCVAAIRARIEIEKAQRPGDPIIATLEKRADRGGSLSKMSVGDDEDA